MNVASAIDTVLDRTIVLGYGDVGLGVRRHLPTWPADPPRMDGKIVVVTGAASGIGLAACRDFAALGASVRAVARDERRAEDAVRQILEVAPGARPTHYRLGAPADGPQDRRRLWDVCQSLIDS